jgi:DNA-binding GntR family transcriptional regulator
MAANGSIVERVAGRVREQILSGALPAGTRLREIALGEEHGAGRHSIRAALRELAAENLLVLEPNRGARVRTLDAGEVVALYELRTALELEAAHLALHRHGGRLPGSVHAAAERLAEVCRGPDPGWTAIAEAHGEVHGAIVRAARSPRIERVHRGIEAETRLFLLQIRPLWGPERMAADHLQLVADLETHGAEPLRAHLRASAAAIVDEAAL